MEHALRRLSLRRTSMWRRRSIPIEQEFTVVFLYKVGSGIRWLFNFGRPVLGPIEADGWKTNFILQYVPRLT